MEPRKIKCPLCGRLTFYSLENPARPFCSERCRLIDLGQWADESYKVPTRLDPELNPDEFSEQAGLKQEDYDDDENS
jgi:uncharacterized protein